MKLLAVLVLSLFLSCSGEPIKRQVFKYQSEQTGKNYIYVHKPSPKMGKRKLLNISYSGFNTEHYFKNDISNHDEFSIISVHSEEDHDIAFGGYFYRGERTIDKFIFKRNYVENLSYSGYGARVNISTRNVSDDKSLSIQILNFQFAVDFEHGEYIKWRNDLREEYDYFVNSNRKETTFSFHWVPELEFHLNQRIDLGIFGGFSGYYNGNSSRYAYLYGFKARYGSIGLSVVNSEMDYKHVYYISGNPSIGTQNNRYVKKYQQRLQVSYLF